jgi:hypothetical protein
MKNTQVIFASLALSTSLAITTAPAGENPSAVIRNAAREFPSVFQAWSPAQIAGEDPAATLARHDLVFGGARLLGLQWNDVHEGRATGFRSDTLPAARARREDLLRRNPRMVFLCEVRYRDASTRFLPEDSPWWKRRADGTREPGWAEGRFFKLDFAAPAYRAQVARQCQAVVETGVFDGVMLDWWDERQDTDARLALLQAVRAAVGREALIIVNNNDRPLPRSAPYIDGLFLECYDTKSASRWKQIAQTLRWARDALHRGRFACLEFWYAQSRQDLHLMRAATTLSLTLSDGYCLFSDPNPLPTPDHLHDWYPFWDKSLGRPVAPGRDRSDGAIGRQFERGLAVHNPLGNRPVVVELATEHRSLATGLVARRHSIPAADGDLFLVK